MKRLAGSITDADNFDRNRKALQAMHKGLFSFLAFHPGVDGTIVEYVEKGSIASDSGTAILVLFFSAKDIRFPRAVTPKDMNIGLDLDMNIHPAYEFVQWLFPTQIVPAFPGLVFMDRVYDVVSAIYIPIATHSSANDVATFCRSIFVLANGILKNRDAGEKPTLDSLSVALKMKGITYSRSGQASVGEWLAQAYTFGKKNGATIVSIIGKLAKV
jgi:hypothetical protein